MDGVDQKTVITNNIKQYASCTSIFNSRLLKKLEKVIKTNKSCLYKNIECDKKLIIEHLNNRYNLTECVNDEVYGEKNLLYFSAFLNDDYIDLLNVCLNSIVKNTKQINFDLLLITDLVTKEKISRLPIISCFNTEYMILPSVADGPEASMKKLNIFDYKNINEYRKILFLDIDSACISDLNKIFDLQISPNVLHVSYSEFTKMQNLVYVPFGILHLSDDDANFFYDNRSRIMPFNAGQFMMINSLKMRMHFDNVRWLVDAWTGPYFYEQSFMNYYFVFRNLVKLLSNDGTNKLICVVGIYWNGEMKNFDFFNFFGKSFKETEPIKPKKLIVSRASDIKSPQIEKEPEFWKTVKISTEYKFHDDNAVVIHFAGFGPGPAAKKKYMIEYANRHNLNI